jgi:hypothetical protein
MGYGASPLWFDWAGAKWEKVMGERGATEVEIEGISLPDPDN